MNFYTYHRHSITVILALILAFGIFTYTEIKVSLFPEITFPKIKIIADNGEQPIDKMMITVTRPLENAIKLVPGLKVIRSTTIRGSCEISTFMDWKSDIDISQQMIESRINEIKNNLPPNTDITVEKMNPSILPVMHYALESTDKNLFELNIIGNYIVKPYLSQVSGISSVMVMGGKTKEYWIILKPQKMSSYAITPAMIRDAMSQTNFITSNGYLSDYKRLYLTLTDAGLYKKEDIENVVIRNDIERVILLKDIADVEIRGKIEYIKINANGKESVLINIVKQPNANLVNLADDLENKVKELAKLLPKGVTLKPLYNQADFVNDSIGSVKDCLWIGLLLAIVIAIFFLRSFRASASVFVIIPAILFLTIIVLYSFGYTLNIMTFGAIAAAIGLIIDDAIVIIEQIHRTHEENPDEKTHYIIKKAISFLLPAMIGSSLSTIVIFIPFILMSGVAGAYFKVLTTTMIITLLCSFFVTWLCLPVVYLLMPEFSRRKKKAAVNSIPVQNADNKSKIENRKFKIERFYSKFIIHRSSLILSFSFIVILILVLIYIYPRLETGFLPEMDEGSIVLDYTSPPGASLDETNAILNEVEKILAKIPEVDKYSRRTGTQMGFYITEPNYGDYLIQLKKDRNRTTDKVIDDIRQKIEGSQPALRVDFGQVINDMLGDLMSSVQPVEIKIFGDNHERLKEIAKQVADVVKKVNGTADVFNGITIAGPSVDIKPDYAKLAQFGITPSDLQFQLKTQLEGNYVGSILEKEQMTNIRMLYPDYSKSGLEKMKSQSVFLPGGKLKPITELATVSLKEGAAEIERENLQTMIKIIARLNERDLGSVMKDIQQQVQAKIHLPQGYYIIYGGAYAEQQQSFRELLFILITASLLVFLVILFLFRDFKASLLILFIAVLGITGSYIALFLTHTPLNVGSYTGLIMIVGIIGENAIFTFQQFMSNLKSSNTPNPEPLFPKSEIQNPESVDDAIVYAISTRLRPKLMTALGTIFALIPLAIGLGAGAKLHQPLAIAVIGGFLVAIPLLLIVLPTMLRLIYKHKP